MSVSLSKSALILSPCLRWAGEGVAEYDRQRIDRDDHEKRDQGIMFHDGLDEHAKGNSYKVRDLKVQRWVDTAVDWFEEHLVPRCEEIHSEVYVSINFETGAVHTDKSVRARAYPEMPGFVPGTADLVCILKTGELLVADWKTGSGVGADKQLLSLAVGFQRVFPKADGGLRKVRAAILYAGEDTSGVPHVHPVEWAVTESDLQSHQHAMAFQLADVGVRNAPEVGVHCSQLYCPHLAYCPGIGAIVEHESEQPQGLIQPTQLVRRFKMTDMPVSDEEAGYTMERITAAKRQMKYYEEGIRAYVDNGGRAISGDFEFKHTKSGFRWVSRV